MENSVYFIPNRALFGPYPTQNDVTYLESIGTRTFIDLTERDKLDPYKIGSLSRYVKYPIPDMKVPYDIYHFSSFVLNLHHILTLDPESKMYIHCRGGNGRSGIVVASLLVRFYKYDITSLEALQLTSKYHSERKNLKFKWKLMGSPQTVTQKNYVIKMFTPFCFYREACSRGNKYGFVPYAKMPLCVYADSTMQQFDDSFALFNYRVSQLDDKDPTEEQLCQCMKDVQAYKITSYPTFMHNIMATLLRPIIYCNVYDTFWGVNQQGDGKNMLGHILMELRDEIFINLFDV